MQLLGHVSAAMSLPHGRLFATTVREEYERALTQAKAQLLAGPTTARGPASDQAIVVGQGRRRHQHPPDRSRA
jgi:hypothetical protein